MKVIVPVAGAGRKLRPHTHTQPKALVPVAGKPIISHIVDNLIEHGLKEFLFITGYLAEKIEQYIHRCYKGKCRYRFIRQSPRLGLAHAISLTKEYISEGEPILIQLGDTIVHTDFAPFLNGSQSVVGIYKVDDPRYFGVVYLNQDQTIKEIVEKPSIPTSNLALTGIYTIRDGAQLVRLCEQLLREKRLIQGEYHLSEALNDLIRQGEPLNAVFVTHWFDCGKKQQLLLANQILLDRQAEEGKLPEFQAENCVIIPPVYIHPTCKLRHAIIGPYVSISEHAEITYVILKNSIVGAYTRLNAMLLENSIIGSDSLISSTLQSLNIGDNAEIHLGG